MHTVHHKNSHHAKLKKIKSSSLGKATYSSYQIVEYILVYYVTNIVNYFVLFFNVLDLYNIISIK